MSTLHDQILDQLLENILSADKTSSDLLSQSRDELKRGLFMNYRSDGVKSRGVRLTNQGLALFQQVFQAYEIPLSDDYRIVNKDLIILDRECTLPYYFNSKKIVLFEKDLALLLKLCDGDIAMVADMPRNSALD